MVDLFSYRPNYPDAAGYKGEADTSREAAEAIGRKLGSLQIRALRAIRGAGDRGLTADELADCLGEDHLSLRPRTSELKLMGLIRDSFQRRRNKSGKRAIVWVKA
jgi:hypothetical protein